MSTSTKVERSKEEYNLPPQSNKVKAHKTFYEELIGFSSISLSGIHGRIIPYSDEIVGIQVYDAKTGKYLSPHYLPVWTPELDR